MHKFILSLTCLLFAGGLSLQAQLITMSVEGSKQGKFKGESLKSKMNDKTELLGYLMDVNVPRDPASGMATGRRQHQPLTILKATGMSSPQFVSAMVTNELLKKVVIEFYKPGTLAMGGSGAESLFYTVVLENVYISSYKQYQGPLNNSAFNAPDATLSEEIKLSYQKITVTYSPGGITAQDDTSSRN